MLPVTTRPPRRPGGFGSPYGKPTEIELSHHHHPRHGHPPGHGQYILRRGCWIVKCGPLNSAWLTYKILVDEDGRVLDDEDSPHNPWNIPRSRAGYPPPDWSREQGPPPISNVVRREELVERGRTGTIFADGQNVTIDGSGRATIIQVFSA